MYFFDVQISLQSGRDGHLKLFTNRLYDFVISIFGVDRIRISSRSRASNGYSAIVHLLSILVYGRSGLMSWKWCKEFQICYLLIARTTELRRKMRRRTKLRRWARWKFLYKRNQLFLQSSTAIVGRYWMEGRWLIVDCARRASLNSLALKDGH